MKKMKMAVIKNNPSFGMISGRQLEFDLGLSQLQKSYYHSICNL